MSNVAFTTYLNGVFTMRPRMDAERKAMIDRVKARMVAVGMQKDGEAHWPALAVALGVDSQLTNNWPHRGIPPGRYHAVASALGWNVEQLLGNEPPNDRDNWPFPNVPPDRIRRLSEADRMRVQAAMIEELEKLSHKSQSARRRQKPPRAAGG